MLLSTAAPRDPLGVEWRGQLATPLNEELGGDSPIFCGGFHYSSCGEFPYTIDVVYLTDRNHLRWFNLGTQVALEDWDWRHPVELQDVPWDCAAASTAWCLQAAGIVWSERDVVRSMVPSYLSPALGLLDASGAGLVAWLDSIGVSAENNPDASWQNVVDAAGYQPMLIGGRAWNHWSGVRICQLGLYTPSDGYIALANPSPGWQGVKQVMDEAHFSRLGPFSAVWFTAW